MNESPSRQYSVLYEKASIRLGFAPNLCGMGGYTAIGSDDTAHTLKVTLEGGWRHGLFPLVCDVATFVEEDEGFVADYGCFHIGKIAALLSDAIAAGDHAKIEAAIIALGGRVPSKRLGGGVR